MYVYLYIQVCIFNIYALIHTGIRVKIHKNLVICVYICESILKWVCVHIGIYINVYLYQMCEIEYIKFEQIY